jgi:hypothetical protein
MVTVQRALQTRKTVHGTGRWIIPLRHKNYSLCFTAKQISALILTGKSGFKIDLSEKFISRFFYFCGLKNVNIQHIDIAKKSLKNDKKTSKKSLTTIDFSVKLDNCIKL